MELKTFIFGGQIKNTNTLIHPICKRIYYRYFWKPKNKIQNDIYQQEYNKSNK